MVKLDEIQKRLLMEVADLHAVPEGAYNIRSNSQSAGRRSTANIEIVPKTDVSGLEIHIAPGTKNESVHMTTSLYARISLKSFMPLLVVTTTTVSPSCTLSRPPGIRILP